MTHKIYLPSLKDWQWSVNIFFLNEWPPKAVDYLGFIKTHDFTVKTVIGKLKMVKMYFIMLVALFKV